MGYPIRSTATRSGYSGPRCCGSPGTAGGAGRTASPAPHFLRERHRLLEDRIDLPLDLPQFRHVSGIVAALQRHRLAQIFGGARKLAVGGEVPAVGEQDPREGRIHGDGRLVFETRLVVAAEGDQRVGRSEEHTSELQSLMRISYAAFCLKK